MKMKQREFLQLCARGSYEEIEEAINNGASINRRAMYNGTPLPPLFVAVAQSNFEAIEVLLKHKAKPVYGFMAAIMANDKYLAKLFLFGSNNSKYSFLLFVIMSVISFPAKGPLVRPQVL